MIPDNPGGKIIDAGGGDDTIIAGAGNDTIYGGAGNDLVSYSYSGAGVSISLADGETAAATVGGAGFARFDVLRSVESLEGSSFSDTLKGNKDNNVLIGGSGNDSFIGGAGGETLDGGSGNDSYNFYAGTQIIESGGNDTVSVFANFNAMTNVVTGTNVVPGTTPTAWIETIRISAGGLSVVGDDSNNNIGPTSAASTLSGSSGFTIDGLTGTDTLSGGTSNDQFIMDISAGDRVLAGAGADTVTFSNTSKITLAGSSFAGILDNVETLDFTRSGVKIGESTTDTFKFTSADIQGIANGSGSTLTIKTNADDFIAAAASTNETVSSSSVTANGLTTTTYQYKSGNSVLATLILQAS